MAGTTARAAQPRAGSTRSRLAVSHWSSVAYSTVVTAKQALAETLIYRPFRRARNVIEDVAFDAAAVPDPLSNDNIVGVGVGRKIRDGEIVGGLCVKVYVHRKVPDDQLGRRRLPRTVKGIPTDVEEIGLIQAFAPSCTDKRHDHVVPAPCGYSVGHTLVNAGTIGAVVRDTGRTDSGVRYILSNNHILAAANRGSVGDPIVQPGPKDGGTAPNDVIAALARFVPLDFSNPNRVDAAVAKIDPAVVDDTICGIGPIQGTVRAAADMTVFKHGRTSGMTRGVITDVDADIKVRYVTGQAQFVNTILIRGVAPTTPFGQPGDSGAAIVDDTGRLCGLLFGGSLERDVTFANPIREVFSQLRIRLP